MPNFRYKAVSVTGRQITGMHIAPDENALVVMLRNMDYYPTEIVNTEASRKVNLKRKLPIKAVGRFCTQIAGMLRIGVPVARSIEILKSESENKQLRDILTEVYDSINEGNSLSDSFAPFSDILPIMFMSLLEAGESGGTLDNCMERAGSAFSRTTKISVKAKSTMIYTSIILILILGSVTLMLTWVTTQFTQMFVDAGVALPGMTQTPVNLGDFVTNNALLIVAGSGAAIFGAGLYSKTEKGGLIIDRLKMSMPLVGKLTTKIYVSRFCRILSTLVTSGVSLPQALDITSRAVVNRCFSKEIIEIREGVTQGKELSTAMEKSTSIPIPVKSVVRLGEESGALEEMLAKIADYYDDESEQALQTLTSLTKPLLIALMAAIMLPLLLAAFLPMFNMFDLM